MHQIIKKEKTKDLFKWILIMLLIIYFPLYPSALAQSNSICYELVKNANDTKLRISTNTITSGMWLALTMYPSKVVDVTKESKTQLFPLKIGKEITEITIPPNFKDGTFEASTWVKKIPKNECHETDTLCQSIGYKLQDMKSYLWGYLTLQ